MTFWCWFGSDEPWTTDWDFETCLISILFCAYFHFGAWSSMPSSVFSYERSCIWWGAKIKCMICVACKNGMKPVQLKQQQFGHCSNCWTWFLKTSQSLLFLQVIFLVWSLCWAFTVSGSLEFLQLVSLTCHCHQSPPSAPKDLRVKISYKGELCSSNSWRETFLLLV